jgi:hypothetical protein
MHPLYTEKYHLKYLDLTIKIFHIGYPGKELGSYKKNENWNEFIELLRETGINKVIVCRGMMVGDIKWYYFHFPLNKNCIPEEMIREKYVIAEKIYL